MVQRSLMVTPYLKICLQAVLIIGRVFHGLGKLWGQTQTTTTSSPGCLWTIYCKTYLVDSLAEEERCVAVGVGWTSIVARQKYPGARRCHKYCTGSERRTGSAGKKCERYWGCAHSAYLEERDVIPVCGMLTEIHGHCEYP